MPKETRESLPLILVVSFPQCRVEWCSVIVSYFDARYTRFKIGVLVALLGGEI